MNGLLFFLTSHSEQKTVNKYVNTFFCILIKKFVANQKMVMYFLRTKLRSKYILQFNKTIGPIDTWYLPNGMSCLKKRKKGIN